MMDGFDLVQGWLFETVMQPVIQGLGLASQRAAIVSIASRFGCSMQTLHDWVVPFEVARPQVCL